MRISNVTIGLPVRDLSAASEWYQRVFELSGADLAPVEGVLEFDLGPVWLQLVEKAPGDGEGVTVRFDVEDVDGERDRLLALGVEVPETERVPGIIDYLDFSDPDGNLLSFYTLTGS